MASRWLGLVVVGLLVCGLLTSASAVLAADPPPGLVWAAGMGGDTSERGLGVAVDGVGNVYTTGFFGGTADFDPGAGVFNLTSAGESDVFVAKLDGGGSLAWAARFGGDNIDLANGVAVDSSGNVYTTGYFLDTADFDPGPGTFNLTSNGRSDVFVSKLDTNGDFVWVGQLGGTSNLRAFGVAVDGAGNVYTTGRFGGTVDFDPGPGVFNLTSRGSSADVFVSKLNTNGEFVWAARMGAGFFDAGLAVAVDDAGYVYTTGRFTGTADFDPGPRRFALTSRGGRDVFVSKLDSNGDFVWAVGMGGTRANEGRGVAVDGAGNVYTTGQSQGTADFDPGPGVFELSGGDVFVSKLESDGTFGWAVAFGGTSVPGIGVAGKGIAVDETGNVFTIGDFGGTADFDPGSGVFDLASNGDEDLFVSKLDTDGSFAWAVSMGGSKGDLGQGMALDGSGNVHTTGVFRETVDFDPGPGVFNLTAGSLDVFVSKLQMGTPPPPPPAATCAGLAATIEGTSGDDVIDGTNGPDVIAALAGDDEVHGNGGDDVICGGRGDDELRGDRGADVVLGQAGEDRVWGGPHGDELNGGNGNDHLVGGGGSDLLQGGNDDDRLDGNSGGDILRGGPGFDRLNGGPGPDQCFGETTKNC